MRKMMLVALVVALAAFDGLIVNVVLAGETGADQTAQFEKLKAGFLGKKCSLEWADGASPNPGETILEIKEVIMGDPVSARVRYEWRGLRRNPNGNSEYIVPLRYNSTYNRWEFQYPRVRGGYNDYCEFPARQDERGCEGGL